MKDKLSWDKGVHFLHQRVANYEEEFNSYIENYHIPS